jgi:hypothetical protein
MTEETGTQHITTIDPEPDSSGHWSWHCTTEGCQEDASGYELAGEVIAAAQAHGPLAADSPQPTDPEICQDCDGDGCDECAYTGEVVPAVRYRVQRRP